MMNLRAFAWCAIFAIAVPLSACTDYQRQFESGSSDYGSRTEYDERAGQPVRMQANLAADHNNTKIAYNQAASDAVSALNGVRSAYVFGTDRHVYVAVLPDSTATGIKGQGKTKHSSRDMNTGDHQFSPHQRYTLPSGDVVLDKYTYPTIPRPENLSSEFVDEVNRTVASMYPSIQLVFVSANAHFINQFSQLANKAWRGEPLEPSLPQFNQWVGEHFGGGQGGVIQP